MFGINDAVKKMALKQFADWMQKENISEVKLSFDEQEEILLTELKKPYVFLSSKIHEDKIAEWKKFANRLREKIRQLETENEAQAEKIKTLEIRLNN
jgi:hypothetical protein